MSKIALITGASSGIGYATSEEFLNRGYTVIASVRNKSSLDPLKNKFPDKLLIWVADFNQLENVHSVNSFLKENKISELDILVNNAGIALPGPFQFQPMSEVENILNVNLMAVIKLTQILIPFLILRQGRIINISSISGVSGMPFLTIYCTSKYALEGFSEALRREMMLYGIKVIVIGPGSIKTPIWNKGFETLVSAYTNTIFSKSFERFLKFAKNESKHALPVEVVVRDIIFAATAEKPKMRYAPIPRKFKNWYLSKLIPAKIYEKMLCKTLGLIK